MFGKLGVARTRSIDAFVRDLRSGEPRTRLGALSEATLLASDVELHDGVERTLIELLGDPESPIRPQVATALADLGSLAAVPALLLAVDDDDALLAELAIAALGELGDDRARDRLQAASRDTRAAIRFAAVAAFARVVKANAAAHSDDALGDAWDALARALVDDDGEVRAQAADACAELADRKPLPSRIADRLHRLCSDDDELSPVRAAAAIALGESGDRRCERVLLEVAAGRMTEGHSGRREAALEIAGELGFQGVREVAAELAFGWLARFGDAGRRSAAMVALARLGDRQAIDWIASELGSSSWARRTLAVGLAGRAQVVALRAQIAGLAGDADKADPDAVADALAQIDHAPSRSS